MTLQYYSSNLTITDCRATPALGAEPARLGRTAEDEARGASAGVRWRRRGCIYIYIYIYIYK